VTVLVSIIYKIQTVYLSRCVSNSYHAITSFLSVQRFDVMRNKNPLPICDVRIETPVGHAVIQSDLIHTQTVQLTVNNSDRNTRGLISQRN